MGRPCLSHIGRLMDSIPKKREALRLLESLDTQALLRLSAKLETRGLCAPAQASPQPPQSVQLNLAGATADYGRGAPAPPMAPAAAAMAIAGMGSQFDFMRNATGPSAEGMQFDFMRNPANAASHESSLLSGPLPVGALPNNASPPAALPVGAVAAGYVHAPVQNSQAIGMLESLVASGSAGYGNNGLAGATPYAQPTPAAPPLRGAANAAQGGPFTQGAPPPPSSPPKVSASLGAAADGAAAPPGLWSSAEAWQEQEAYGDGGDEVSGEHSSNTGGDSDVPATTLILRNLPSTFDQPKAQEWLDSYGFQGTYDFVLWFPAKATSRLNSCGYAFVNFRTNADAQNCMKKLHLVRFPDVDGNESLPLSVAVAKVQGFAENYTRFHHLLEANAPTRCSPFFAQDSIDALSQAERAVAENTASNPAPALGPSGNGPVTTIVIRNLPSVIQDTEIARQWLDAEGCGRQYDFFLYLPAKRQRRVPGKPQAAPQGYGYAFVNFKKAEDAERCVEKLNGKVFGDGTPALNIVAAKVQGKGECIQHFNTLTDSGRCLPWVEPVAAPLLAGPPRTVFQ